MVSWNWDGLSNPLEYEEPAAHPDVRLVVFQYRGGVFAVGVESLAAGAAGRAGSGATGCSGGVCAVWGDELGAGVTSMTGNARVWFIVLVTALYTGCGPNTYLENNLGVPVALDLPGCEILAMNEFQPSDETRAAYNSAIGQGRIVQPTNGTFVRQGELLNFENHHLIPWVPTGPITVAEERRRHIGVYEWMIPTEGQYQGRRVCVSTSMRRGRYAMP